MVLHCPISHRAPVLLFSVALVKSIQPYNQVATLLKLLAANEAGSNSEDRVGEKAKNDCNRRTNKYKV